MNENKGAQIAVLVDGAGRRVQLGQLVCFYEPPTLMASTGSDEADIAAAISAASATGSSTAYDPNAAPDWLVGGAPAAAVDIGR